MWTQGESSTVNRTQLLTTSLRAKDVPEKVEPITQRNTTMAKDMVVRNMVTQVQIESFEVEEINCVPWGTDLLRNTQDVQADCFTPIIDDEDAILRPTILDNHSFIDSEIQCC
ncbi:hypothetical protein ElyMa_005244700 [Elysia marginata]|uniref:Uncharacterized protein n=1 Tax=Elysia marginata TaxID=1093978 RepID=A0AAV4K1X0_9GAST|nr:hypothetical protein ElyMa_005244700 [Elysia marginata]